MESSIRIEEIAADWLARRDGGEWTSEDEAALNHWLESSTAHWAAYIRLRAAWNEANRLKAMGAGLGVGTLPSREEQHFVPFFGRRTDVQRAARVDNPKRGSWVPWSAAAVLVMALAIWIAAEDTVLRASYSTPTGGMAAVPLSDGSQATLNTRTEIRVAITDAERRVTLVRGEAFFDVARDPSRPFVVLAGARKVTAVGTSFSVRRDRDEVQIVVTEGRVRVDDENERLQPSVPLTAGAVARTRGNAIAVQQRSAPEAEEYLTWRSGFIVFKDVPLSDAVAEFNRYVAHPIEIEDPAIASIRIGGNFRTANVGAFLRILEADFPIQVQEQADRVTLLKSDR